ncbi:MAG: MFS transporter [Myxococcota bacterium]
MFIDLLDELASGVPVLGAPDLRAAFELRYGGTAWIILVGPILLATFIEAPLLARSDRWPRERSIAVALLFQAVFLGLAGLTTHPWGLALALGLWGAAAGVTTGVAQAALIAETPGEEERVLARWAFFGSLGDALAPPLVGASLAILGSLRPALFAVAAVLLFQALAIALLPRESSLQTAGGGGDEPAEEEEADPSWGAALRTALRAPGLLLWLGAAQLCTLLDEIVVAFGGMYMRDVGAVEPALRSAAFLLFAAAGALALAVVDRLLVRHPPELVLRFSALLCGLSFGAWFFLRDPAPMLLAFALVGAFAAPLYPMAQAQAFRASPGRPGRVAAVEKLLAPIDALAPLVLGWIADRAGIQVAVALLVLEPLGLLVISLTTSLTSRRRW